MLRLFLSLWLATAPVYAGSMSLLGAGVKSAAGGSFTGPGDVVGSASIWWGLRAYSAATTGSKSANICNSGDANCADVNTLANGDFDVATATGAPLNCGGAGGTCTIKTLYDKIGTGCGGSNCNVTNTTIANRPTLVLSCLGSLPCMAFSGTQFLLSTNSTNPTPVQPLTMSMIGKRTGNTSAANDIFLAPFNMQVGFWTSSGQMFCAAGAALIVSGLTEPAFHAVNAVANGVSSNLYIDGANNTGNCGTNDITSSPLGIGGSGSSNQLTGQVTEIGVWLSAFNGTQMSNMNSNQHTYWGF